MSLSLLSIFSNDFFSEATGLIEAKLHIEPPWVERIEIYSQGLAHMINIATTPIFGKNSSIVFFSYWLTVMGLGSLFS